MVGPALGGLLLGAGHARPCAVGRAWSAWWRRGCCSTACGCPHPSAGADPKTGGVLLRCAPSAVLRGAVAAVAVVNAVAASGRPGPAPARGAWDGVSEGTAFGIATGALGFGALGGPLLGRLAARWGLGPRVWLFVLAGCLTGVAALVVALDGRPAAGLAGAAAVQVEIVATAYVQGAAPDRLRASVLGLTDTAMVAAALVGALVAPVLAGALGPRVVVLVAAAGSVAAVAMVRRPVVRAGNRRRPRRSLRRLSEQYSGGVDFYSAYAQGFARVAACTVPVAIADPARNAAIVLEQARACHDDGVAVAVFPELCLTGYAIDDLLLQDTLLDGGRRRRSPTIVEAQRRPAARDRGRRAARARHPGLNCAVVIHRGPGPRRRAEVLPAELPRVLRAAPLRARATTARGATHRASAGGDVPVRPRPDLRGHRRARPRAARRDLRGHVGAGPAERRGRAGRRDRAGQPLRQPDHGRPRRGPPAAGPQRQRALQRGLPLRRRRPGRVDAPTCRGTARRWSTSAATCSAESERFPDGPRRTVVDVDLDRIRQERLRQGTFDDNRRTARRRASTAFRTVEFALDAADRRHRAAPQGRPVPVRARRRRAAGARLLRGLQHPGLRARAAAARHRRSPRSSSASAAASTRPTR